MKIELHLLQNFPPSCLNRDDTNSPKDCEFGGVRRARISSQSLKRAMREHFRSAGSIPDEELTVRTKRTVDFMTAELAKLGRTGDGVPQAIELLLQAGNLAVKKEDEERKTQYLLFLPKLNLVDLASLANKNWEKLAAALKVPRQEEPTGKDAKKAKKKEKREAKDAASEALGEELEKKVRALLFGSSNAPELALFGRMIADEPGVNVDAACQVAHALSTHRVAMEFDFYTAVDDLKPHDDQGADMMGTIQFNSACFYKYSVVDVPQLARTLAGVDAAGTLTLKDREKAKAATLAYVEAAIHAVPSARQNGMAAWTKPALVLSTVRHRGMPLSLANAFVKPVRPGPGQDLVDESTRALAGHLADLAAMYGTDGATYRYAAERKALSLEGESFKPERRDSVADLVKALEADLNAWVEGQG
jgi:CRISPR system Cascade subunit CasC